MICAEGSLVCEDTPSGSRGNRGVDTRWTGVREQKRPTCMHLKRCAPAPKVLGAQRTGNTVIHRGCMETKTAM